MHTQSELGMTMTLTVKADLGLILQEKEQLANVQTTSTIRASGRIRCTSATVVANASSTAESEIESEVAVLLLSPTMYSNLPCMLYVNQSRLPL